MVVILAPKCSSYLRIAAGTTEMGRKSDVVGEGCRGLYRWAPQSLRDSSPKGGAPFRRILRLARMEWYC